MRVMTTFRPKSLRAKAALVGFVALMSVTTATALAQSLSVGQEAPGFNLESSQGERFELASLRGDKQALLVFYRGTW